jgi:hypothetical protein
VNVDELLERFAVDDPAAQRTLVPAGSSAVGPVRRASRAESPL